MTVMLVSLKLFIGNLWSYVSTLVRVSVVTPLDAEEGLDADAIARDSGTNIHTELGEVGCAYDLPRRLSRHPGYITSNGLGSLEVGGADD